MTMEDAQADVIVVGGGGSGLAAAVSAAEQGAAVILVEKGEELGGTTAKAIGSITASGTEYQRKLGIEDSAQAHFEDMPKFSPGLAPRDNPALRKLLTQNVPSTVTWLELYGVRFFGPLEEKPHRVPRMHNVMPSATAYIYHLSKGARARGVDIRLNTAASRVIIENGRAVGIEARQHPSRAVRFLARRGVVLAGGDYSGNSVWKTQRCSPDIANVPAVNRGSTGDCQRMIEEIGGEIVNADLYWGPTLRFPSPTRRRLHEIMPPHPYLTAAMRWALRRLPHSVVRPFIMSFMTGALGPETSLLKAGALLIGTRGEIIEWAGRTPGQAVAAQADNVAYLVFDDTLAKKLSEWPNFVSTAPGVAYAYLQDYKRNRRDIYRTAATVDELARALAIPVDGLRRSLGGTDGVAQLKAPLHVLGPVSGYIILTEGGAKVSLELEVLDKAGTPIPGLYAAGSTGQGGLLLEGHGHHLGWAFTSGRIAGRNAADPQKERAELELTPHNLSRGS